jgi:hypothetical protein
LKGEPIRKLHCGVGGNVSSLLGLTQFLLGEYLQCKQGRLSCEHRQGLRYHSVSTRKLPGFIEQSRQSKPGGRVFWVYFYLRLENFDDSVYIARLIKQTRAPV